VSRPPPSRVTSGVRRQVALGFVAGLVFVRSRRPRPPPGSSASSHAGALHLLGWWTYLTPSPQIVVVGIDDRSFIRLRAPQAIPHDYLATVIRGAQRSGPASSPRRRPERTAAPAKTRARRRGQPAAAGGVPVVLASSPSPSRTPSAQYARPAARRQGRRPGSSRPRRRGRAGPAVPGAPARRRGPAAASFALGSSRRTAEGSPARRPPTAAFSVTGFPGASGSCIRGRPPPPRLRVTDEWRTSTTSARARPSDARRRGGAGRSTGPSSRATRSTASDRPRRPPPTPRAPTLRDAEGGRWRASRSRQHRPHAAHSQLARAAHVGVGPGGTGPHQPRGAALSPACIPRSGSSADRGAGGFVPLRDLVYGSGDFWIDLGAAASFAVFIRCDHRRLAQRRLQDLCALRQPRGRSGSVRARRTPPSAAEQREVTILFCDLRVRTGLARTLDERDDAAPEPVLFEMVTEPSSAGGSDQRFIGDGISRSTTPRRRGEPRRRRRQTALETVPHERAEQALGRLAAHRLESASGSTRGRHLGQRRLELRLEYTIIGDPVNVASRVEG